MLVIACEGKTEERLLTALSGHLRIPAKQIEVSGQQGVPRTVVDAAEKMRDEQLAKLPRREQATVPLQTWAVFDRDEHESWLEACNAAAGKRIELAISNPCFELWGILMYQDQTAHIHRHEAQRVLSGLHPAITTTTIPTWTWIGARRWTVRASLSRRRRPGRSDCCKLARVTGIRTATLRPHFISSSRGYSNWRSNVPAPRLCLNCKRWMGGSAGRYTGFCDMGSGIWLPPRGAE